MRLARRTFAALACATVVGGLPVAPVFAAPSDTGVGVVNLSESEGCDPGVSGPDRPESSSSGFLDAAAIVRGPWGDVIGRSRTQITGSLVDWRIFGSNQTVRIHERIVPAAQLVDAGIAEVMSDGLNYPIPAAAAFVWRTVGGAVRFSAHAFGTAVDVNPAQNPYSRTNRLITNMPPWFRAIWNDAGFCWGGDWLGAKDPMHYSWSGPGLTPGYPGRPAPYAPLTGVVPFNRVALSTTTSLGSVPGAQFGLGDFSGDGSADLYRLRPHGSGSRLEVVGSAGGYRPVGLRHDFPFSTDRMGLIADHDLDGRPDVWRIDTGGETVAIEVWTSQSDYETAVTLPTGVSTDEGFDYALTLFDGDYAPDLIVIDRSGPTTATVYAAEGGYTTTLRSYAIVPDDTSDSGQWAIIAGDWDVDGVTDLYAVRKGANATVTVATAQGNTAHLVTGLSIDASTDVLIGDFDGDGRDDLYLRTDGALAVLLGGSSAIDSDLTDWYVKENPVPWDAGPECLGPHHCDSIGFVDAGGAWHLADAPASGTGEVSFFFGNPGDVPFSGDWDCDGIDTPGLFRTGDGYVYLRGSNTQGVADQSFFFGNPGDVPIVGDFDGDGCDTVSVYRPAEGRFYIIDRMGSGDAELGAASQSFLFGNPGDTPFVGDFDGDGGDDIGLHRRSTGFVYLRYSLSPGNADHAFFFGDPGDVVMAGDWDGDGKDTVAIFRSDVGNWYLELSNNGGVADHAMHFHSHDTVTRPVAGHFATDSRG